GGGGGGAGGAGGGGSGFTPDGTGMENGARSGDGLVTITYTPAPGCTTDRSGATRPQVIFGTPDADVICGSEFNDAIFAGGGDDQLLGGAGNDALFGEGGADTIDGSVQPGPPSTGIGIPAEFAHMSDSELTAIEDLRASAPIEAGKLGHHTVLETAGARVIVLAFERGHHMKEHRAPRPLLLQAVDGHLRITAAERTVDLRPGGLMHLPASMPHAVEAVEPSRLSLILLG
ncbi:MAG: cupin domain-containing protein, partial [Pseudonocardia sp.]|nr:cupin domain-containing protein [Pseudonocardia sp.]